jgi:hypothetical protein
MARTKWFIIVFALATIGRAHADAALLLEEPFGTLGHMAATGHAAIYLTRVCAETPTQLRRCGAGESGVVISRYHHIAGYDWLAVPFLPYLYAVETLQEVPASADAQSVAAIRDRYRRDHLLAIAPDDAEGRAPGGEWTQLVGSAYDRTIYGFLIQTSQERDDAFIQQFNQRNNQSHFNLLFHNCADFSRTVLNFYYRHAVHRSFLADAGITTPKQVAKSLAGYSRRHPDLARSSFVIPQLAGSIPRSGAVHGVVEALLKSKKYVVPLAILHPVITGCMALGYLTEGRFNPRREASIDASIFEFARQLEPQPQSRNERRVEVFVKESPCQ